MPGFKGFILRVSAERLSSIPGRMKEPSYTTPESKASCKASLMAWAHSVHVLPYLYLEL